MTRSGNVEEGQVPYLSFVTRSVRLRLKAGSQIISLCLLCAINDLSLWCFDLCKVLFSGFLQLNHIVNGLP